MPCPAGSRPEKGVALANGDYIWIAESDDFADRSLVERLVEILNENKKQNITYIYTYII